MEQYLRSLLAISLNNKGFMMKKIILLILLQFTALMAITYNVTDGGQIILATETGTVQETPTAQDGVVPQLGTGTTYYIDAVNGNDSYDGMSKDTAWQTTAKVSNMKFNPGENVLFKRGQIFYGTLEISSQGTIDNPILYGSYGEGNKPTLSDLKTKTFSWTDVGNNIWKTSDLSLDIKRLRRNGQEILVAPTQSELGQAVPTLYEWYYSSGLLYLYSTTNPNNDSFTFSQNKHIISSLSKSYITLYDLQVYGGNEYAIYGTYANNVSLLSIDVGYMAYNAIRITNAENLLIDSCTIDAHWTLDYSGAGYTDETWKGTREGLWLTNNVHAPTVRNNIIKDWHHSGINLVASLNSGEAIDNLKFYNNYITSPNIPYGGRLNLSGNIKNSEFYDNTFKDMRGGRLQIGGGTEGHNKFYNNLFENMSDSPLKGTGIEGGAVRIGDWLGENQYQTFTNNVFIKCGSLCIDIGGGDNSTVLKVHDIIFSYNKFDEAGISGYQLIRIKPYTENNHFSIDNNIFEDSGELTYDLQKTPDLIDINNVRSNNIGSIIDYDKTTIGHQ